MEQAEDKEKLEWLQLFQHQAFSAEERFKPVWSILNRAQIGPRKRKIGDGGMLLAEPEAWNKSNVLHP